MKKIIKLIDNIKSLQEDIVILGPTASGKTKLSIFLSQATGNPIVNCDTRQFWKNLQNITCSPTKEQKILAPHLLFNNLENEEKPSLGYWAKEIQKIDKKIIVGGSMFYPYCLIQGIPQVDISSETKKKCENIKNADEYLKLMNIKVDSNDKYRVRRMLEFFIETGTTFNHFPNRFTRKCKVFSIMIDDNVLKRNIKKRIDNNIQNWIEECQANQNQNFESVIGYRECLNFYKGMISEYKLIEIIFQKTIQYSKKQVKFIRRFNIDYEININEIEMSDFL